MKNQAKLVKLFVVASSEISADDVISHCRENLTGYKVQNVEFRDELPKSNVGKFFVKT